MLLQFLFQFALLNGRPLCVVVFVGLFKSESSSSRICSSQFDVELVLYTHIRLVSCLTVSQESTDALCHLAKKRKGKFSCT